MGDIISFVARKKQSKLYNEGARCAARGHEWVAVASEGGERIECGSELSFE